LPDTDEILAFGSFTMDLRRRALFAGETPVALHPRAFDLLECLIINRARVLSRDEIVAHVWRGMAIGENNLAVQLSALRRALAEHNAEGLIITLPGRGYRFVGDVINPPPTPVTAPDITPQRVGWRRPVLPALAGAALLCLCGVLVFLWTGPKAAPRLSIVVMPLRDLSAQPDDRYLADAISDDLTTDLAHIPGSLVIARETADTLRDRKMTAEAIGKTLHVRYLLETSLRAEASALHINTQLIDTESGTHLWAERFDVPREKFGQARDMIVARIGGRLDAELVRLEATRAEHDRPGDPDALDLFFRARSITDHDDTLQGFQAAQALLESALQQQPSFADADAELADMLIRKVRSTDDPSAQADLAEANAAITRALALSPHNAVALAAQAHARFVDGRLTDAAYSARAALDSDPSNLEARDVLAGCDLAANHLPEATATLEDLVRRDPAGAVAKQRLLRLGNLLLLQGRPDEAADRLHEAIAGDPDPQPGTASVGRAEGVHYLLIAATALAGRLPEARTMYAAYDRLWPHRTSWRLGATASKAMFSLPGFNRILQGLEAAGMPRYADEHADDHVPQGVTLPPVDAFVPTPKTLPGADTIDTATLAGWIKQGQEMVLIDLGGGAAVISGAHLPEDGTQDLDGFVDRLLQGVPNDAAHRKIVLMADGTYGSTSYNAAHRLVASGRHDVVWCRGGEEAWAKAGFPSTDQRH
jgi:TolB-like protein/DNA-binding winged helix-turn-helix (wHTH) protein/rhodanese-related sulfurtransferase